MTKLNHLKCFEDYSSKINEGLSSEEISEKMPEIPKDKIEAVKNEIKYNGDTVKMFSDNENKTIYTIKSGIGGGEFSSNVLSIHINKQTGEVVIKKGRESKTI